MKKQLVILLCLVGAPLAFAQTTATDKANSTVTQNFESNKVATITAYEPGKSITVNSTTVTHPVKYVVASNVQCEKKGGGQITPDLLKPGSRVELDFDAEGQVNRISLIELR
jgi:hypothetical protein